MKCALDEVSGEATVALYTHLLYGLLFKILTSKLSAVSKASIQPCSRVSQVLDHYKCVPLLSRSWRLTRTEVWLELQETLTHPDERQLARGINVTGVPAALKAMVDALVWESTRTEEGYVWRITMFR